MTDYGRYIKGVDTHERAGGLDIVIVVDDVHIEKEAEKAAVGLAADKAEAQRKAKQIGNQLATQAVMEALHEVEGAFDPAIRTDVEVNSKHEINL